MRTLCTAALLFASLAPAQTTWFVDALGGGNFTDIPPAIAAASPGDHILVLGTATYSAFVVDRGVDVEAVTRARAPTIEVVGVPAGQSARVAGFDVNASGGAVAVAVRNCQGGVILSDLQMVGTLYQTTTAHPGLEVVDAARVFVDRGYYRGQASSGGDSGLRMLRSRAAVYGTSFVGGVSVSSSSSSGNSGRPGISAGDGCHLLLDQVTARGGNASSGSIVGGNGGDGLSVSITAQAVAAGQCTLQGTPAGYGSFISGNPGCAITGPVRYTQDCVRTGATTGATAIPDRAVLRGQASVAIGTPLTFTAQGSANQGVWLLLDVRHDHVPVAGLDGALVVTANAASLGLLTIDSSGVGSWSLALPNTPLLAGLDVFCQGLCLAGGAPVLMAPGCSHTH